MSIKKLATTLWMFLFFSLSYAGTARFHNINMDSSFTVKRCVGTSTLDSLFGIQNGSRVMKAAAVSSIAPDSVRASHKTDVIDTIPPAVTTDCFITKDASDSILRQISIAGAWNSLHISDSINSTGMVWDTVGTHDFPGCIGNVNGVAYGFGRFVAIGGTVLYGNPGSFVSTDCKNWHFYNHDVLNNILDLTFGNGVFIGVTGSRGIMTSPDGMYWTERTFGITTSEQPSAIEFGNGNFLIIPGNGDSVYISSDGITWSAKTAKAGFWKASAYGNGKWRAVGNSGGTYQAMYSDDDGETWSVQTASSGASYAAVAYGNGKWVAASFIISGLAVIDTCSSGNTWVRADTLQTNFVCRDLIYYNNTFIACGSDYSQVDSIHNIATSKNGSSWTMVETPSLADGGGNVADPRYLAAGNGLVCAGMEYQSNCMDHFLYSGAANENIDIDLGVADHDHCRLVDSIADTAVVRVVNGKTGVSTVPSTRYLTVRQNIQLVGGGDSGLVELISSPYEAVIIRAHQRIADGSGANFYKNTSDSGSIKFFTNALVRLKIGRSGLVDSIYELKLRWLANYASDSILTVNGDRIVGYRSARGIVPDSSHTLLPTDDNTYYLGKNDDDSPKAYKGIILRDQTDGKYYRIELNSGAISIVDLTD